jgi:uncharacterized protein
MSELQLTGVREESKAAEGRAWGRVEGASEVAGEANCIYNLVEKSLVMAYFCRVIITWDESKRVANIDKHGLDFAGLTLAFFLSATIYPSKKGRRVAIGRFEGLVVIAVIFAPLGTQAISVISMRPASRRERLNAT